MPSSQQKKPQWLTSTAPVPYEEALVAMQQRVEDIIEGKEPELLWLLEHPPLYTSGTSAKAADLLPDATLPVFETGRGGQYTYHGPGQRVIYAMMDLRGRDQDLRAHVWRLEEWIIQTLACFDIKGERRKGRIGIWVETEEGAEKKIAALGVRARRWVTSHGLALNVYPDLSHYGGIVPCGLPGYGVTSMHDLGVKVSMVDVDQAFQSSYKNVFG